MKKSPVHHREYPRYVDNLRKKFAIRIEINMPSSVSEESHTKNHNDIKKYLKGRCSKHEWTIQHYTGYNGLFFIWFKNKEDAVAFTLTWGGSVI